MLARDICRLEDTQPVTLRVRYPVTVGLDQPISICICKYACVPVHVSTNAIPSVQNDALKIIECTWAYTGLTHIDFITLPAKAKISCSYQVLARQEE
jgi:hypothetical protein